MSYSRDQINNWLEKIDVSGKTVIDIGSGPKDKGIIHKVKGEPSIYKTAECDKAFSSDYYFDLNEKAFCDVFDMVFCIEVLEHIWDPVTAIKNLYDITGETLFIAIPFINPHHDKWDYLRYTGEWFNMVLKKIGFKDVIVKERVATKGKKLLQKFYKIEGLRISQIRPEYGNYTYPIGYLIEAKK